MKTDTNDARPQTKFKSIVVNIIILSVSISAALAVAEFVARRYVDTSYWPPFYVGEYENRKSENFVADDYTGWRMRSGHSFTWKIGDGSEANVYAANAAGFRSDKEFLEHGPVAVVGDSFTFGTGVAYEHSFGALLETSLAGLPVYNFAMPGFGIDQMWMSLKHKASRFDSSFLVVAFIDEDFDRSLTAFRKFEGFNKPSYVLDNGELRRRTQDDQPPDLVKKMRRHLALSSVISQNITQLGHHLPLGSWWSINAAILQQIEREARAMGAPVLFVRLPSRGQQEFGTLSALMKEMGAHYLDLEDVTRDYPEDEIFIPDDGHINEAGHQLVAEAIFDWISANPKNFKVKHPAQP
jgi:hypothetical protein